MCGHEFETGLEPIIPIASDIPASVSPPKIGYGMSEGDIAPELMSISVKTLLYCGPYKEIRLSCGHSFRCEFSQFHKGQKTWCRECKKKVEVVKCIDTVTGKEYDRL